MPSLPTSLPSPRTGDLGTAPGIRWGIIAPGWIAGRFTETLHRNTAARVTAIGSSSMERARRFAERFGVERCYDSYEQLAADPGIDAVYVASPHSHHHEQVLLALSAGKPVLVEKAFTQNAAQAADVIGAARGAGLLLMEAMWTRFLPHMDVVRQLIEDGVLGDIQTVISDHGQYFEIGPEHRLLNPDLAGGALLDLGIYPISFTSFVLGTPDSIAAEASMTVTGVDAQVSAALRTGTAHGLVSATQTAKTPTTGIVAGTAARVEIEGDFYQPQPVRLVSRDGEARTNERGPFVGHEGLAYEAAHFATLLREGRTESPLLPLDETLTIMRTLDEIRHQIGLVYPNER